MLRLGAKFPRQPKSFPRGTSENEIKAAQIEETWHFNFKISLAMGSAPDKKMLNKFVLLFAGIYPQ